MVKMYTKICIFNNGNRSFSKNHHVDINLTILALKTFNTNIIGCHVNNLFIKHRNKVLI